MRLLVSLALAGAALAPALAQATPRPLPVSYTADTLPAGKLEIEPAVDYTRVRARDHATGELAWYGASSLQLEVEYGLTDRLELGLYVTTALRSPDFDDTPRLPTGNGMKQRLRWRVTEPGAWPIDVALYGEVSENEREIELEGKVILQAQLGGGVRAVTNLWAEREYYFDGRQETVINPTAALTWEITPKIHPGVEAWLRAEYPDEGGARGFNLGPHLYVGPTLMLDFGKLWLSTGVYWRATDADHTLEPGDAYGRAWARVLFGISVD